MIYLAIIGALASGALGWMAAVGWHDVGGMRATAKAYEDANKAWVEQARKSDEATERLRLASLDALNANAKAVRAAEANAQAAAVDADAKVKAMLAAAQAAPKETTCATATEAIEAGRAFLESRR